MSVLLTGAAGYVGSHTCVELLNRGFSIVGIDNYINSSPVALDRVRQITSKDFPSYELDLRDERALRAVFEAQPIEAVIHFAGLKAVGESVKKPLEYYDNNLYGSIVLLKVMREFAVRSIIFSSSATVYGAATQMPLREDMALGCVNPYGWTKFAIEQMLRDLCAADPGFSAVLLRYFNPVGAHESGLIGDDPSGIPNNLLPYVTRVAVEELQRLPVFGNDYNTPDGTPLRDYIHVSDLARGHVAAMEYAGAHKGCEAVNLGTGKASSVLEVIKTFEQVNGVPIPYFIAPRRAGDADESWSSTEKAERLLGWKAEKGLGEMLRDAWRWQKQNPKGYHA
ncbi:MAG: UDP-glucose 4-epimerase GalE [Christensenellaceae bacterium]|jgi:UDP-glucose 4-epimerase|nr:UDP-glucose 4-epimerase GalE [Christensenellaceae bacterium]